MMTVHPVVGNSVKGVNIQQHSHGVNEHVGNTGQMPCSGAVMRDACTVS